MSNLFDGIITPELQDLFNQGVSELLDPTNTLTVKCRIIYPATTYDVSDTPSLVGKPHAFHYITGAPIPPSAFADPAEGPTEQKAIQTTEDIDVIAVFDPKKFVGGNLSDIIKEADPYTYVQIMGFISLLPKIQQAQEFIVNTENENYNRMRYVRLSEPTPLGLFDKNYFLCVLKRAG